jgi:hypothetical protein
MILMVSRLTTTATRGLNKCEALPQIDLILMTETKLTDYP